MKIGVIGLGLMGGGIARHLGQKITNDLIVYDVMEAARIKFKDIANIAPNVGQVVEFSEIIILSLPGAPEVEKVMDDIFDTKTLGQKTVIDLSTSYPTTSKRLYERMQEMGGDFLDASLTGNPARALEGKLHAIVGGKKETYEKMLPVFSLFTERTFYAGGPGTGNLIKLGTNYLAILYINLYSEVFSLIEKNGGDLDVFYQVVSDSVAGCGMFERIAPKIMNENYELSFMLKHAIKDLQYMKQLGLDQRVPSLMLDAGLSQFFVARSKGLGEKDVSEVDRVVKEWIL